MTDIAQIRTAIIKTVRELVGDRLSTLKGGSLPAVIKDNSDGPAPEFPYIVVAYKRTVSASKGRLLNQYYDDAKEEQVLVTLEHTYYEITCYGDLASDIINQLQTRMQHSFTRAKMNKEADAIFVNFTDPEDTVKFLPSGFQDVALCDIVMGSHTFYSPSTDDGRNIQEIDVTGAIGDLNTSDNITAITD